MSYEKYDFIKVVLLVLLNKNVIFFMIVIKRRFIWFMVFVFNVNNFC